MTRLRQGTVALGMGLAALLVTVASCSDDPTGSGGGGGGGGGGGNISDPATLQAFVEASFIPGFVGVADGIARLLDAINGGTPDGVTVTPTGPNTVAASILLDLDGDGTRETTVSGGANGDVNSGGTIFVDPIVFPSEPTASVAFSATVTLGLGIVVLDFITATMSADPPGSGNAAVVDITGGSLSFDMATGAPDGFMDCDISGEGQSISVTTGFVSDGQGGFSAQFTGAGLDFTVSPP